MKALKIILIIIAALAALFAIYAYRNMNYDYLNTNFMEKTGKKLGFIENRQFYMMALC